VALAVAAGAWFGYLRFAAAPLAGTAPQASVVIRRGDGFRAVIGRLREHGNTIVVIEHNLDVIKTADWVIDLGPEGGAGGGQIIACGTPEDVAANPASHTGHYLQRVLQSC
jgi:ABC-type branched-subunit amino acid transport system ATPase component